MPVPAPAPTPTLTNTYESKKDSGKPNVDAAVVTPARVFYGPSDKDAIVAYNNQRTGISAPPKYDKPWSVLDAVVVHSIPSAVPSTSFSYVAIPAQNYPFLYYKDNAKAQQAQTVQAFTTTPAPQKSVQVELNYKDDTVVEKTGENAVLHRKVPANATELVQTTSESSAFATDAITAAVSAINLSSPVSASVQRQNSSSPLPESSAKWTLQNRPIKLLGSNTFHTAPANFTFTPQLYYAPVPMPMPVPDIQYVPYPFLKSPLLPPFLYRNVPRAVSERSEISASPSPSPAAFQLTNKPEKPICDNCLQPSNFPTLPHALKVFDADNNVQGPCTRESASNSPTSSTFKSSNLANLAYVLVPSQIIKNHPSRKR